MINWFEMLLATAATALTASLIPALLILVIGIVIIKLVNKLAKAALEKTKLEKAAVSLILSLTKVVLFLLLGLMAASNLGIDVTGVIALASVLTLAVSLALQNALANVFGGFVLLSTHPFHAGDFVEVAGQSGAVSYTHLTLPTSDLV